MTQQPKAQTTRATLPAGASLLIQALLSATLLATALSAAGTAYGQSWPSLDQPQPQGGGERDAALIIGIDDYIFVPDVPGAAENANAWFRFFAEGRDTPLEHLTLLRNHEGTREKMLRALKEAKDNVQPGGTLWVVFIGHGAPDPQSQDGVLIGADVQQDADSLYARSIGQRDILAAVQGGPQAQTVLVLDACFSGRTSDGAPLVAGLQPLVLVNAPQTPPGVLVFTAAQSDQFAGPLPGLGRPAFSYLMLGALRGWADRDSDQTVTAREALDYTRLTLAAAVKDRSQTPTLLGLPSAPLSGAAIDSPPDLSSILTDGGASPTKPLHTEGRGTLRIESKDGGDYQLRVLTADGSEYACERVANAKTPCVLKNIPPGRVVLRISGDLSYEETTTLGEETIVIGADGASGWYGWAAIGSAAGGFIASIVFVSSSATSSAADDGFSATTIAGITMTPILWTTSLVFGVLWFLDNDKVTTQRFDAGRTSSTDGIQLNWGVAPTTDGGMVGLTLTW
jgi:hypothetical protein